MSDNLESLKTCGKPWAEKRANAASEIQAQYKSGDLQKDEALELMGDLINTDKLNRVADDIQIKAALINAINIAMML